MKLLNYKITIFILTFIVLLVSNFKINAQWNASVTLDQEYNNNPFRSPEAHASWISNLNGQLQNNWEKYAFRYFGSYLKFNLLPERNFYWHQLAFWGGSDTLNYGSTVDQRFGRTDYTIYNYTSGSAYLNYRFKLSDFWLTTSNNISLNNYSKLEPLNNWQFNSKLQLNKGFRTRTSLIGGVGIYFKKYLPSQTEYIMTGLDTISSGQNYQDKGQGRGQRNIVTPIYEFTHSESPSLGQFSYWLRIAQSITPTTGLAVQFQQRNLIKGLDRYVSGLAFDYSSESQLFDDPMGFESFAIGSELTKLLPANITLKLAYYLSWKDYISQGIYLNSETFDEQNLREDDYQTAWLSLAKEIFFSETRDQGLLVQFNYQYITNNSNSYWYNYSNKSWSIGLEFSF